MCQAVKECGFWTWDKDDNKCYLVKTEKYLEPSDDKISGSSDCIEFTELNNYISSARDIINNLIDN